MRSMSNSELHLFVFEGAFTKQLEKHINHKCPEVAVLSAFPIYVLDYYGVEGVKRKLDESYSI